MKDWDEAMIRSGRPNMGTLEGVRFCLRALVLDKEHRTSDAINPWLTFEELLGVLLLAEDDALEAMAPKPEGDLDASFWADWNAFWDAAQQGRI